MVNAGAKDYLDAKGGRVARSADSPSAGRRPAPALPQDQLERLQRFRADLHQHMPEFEPFIMELYALGMVDGWRCLKEVKVLKSRS
jgi:hypothetical protein